MVSVDEKTVLPTTTYLSVMGYLVNVAISTVTDAILAQQDITEEESNHLNELLRTLHPLEELFVLEAGQVCLFSLRVCDIADEQPSSVVEHVHGWLKFCYLSELLVSPLRTPAKASLTIVCKSCRHHLLVREWGTDRLHLRRTDKPTQSSIRRFRETRESNRADREG